MNDNRKRFECPKCHKVGWLYREGNELICCECEYRFESKRKDDEITVPKKWEI